MAKDTRPRDHYVSAGWQKNFADLVVAKDETKGFVSQFSVVTGEIVERRRNVNRSMWERDYGTFWNEDGTRNRTVDDLFSNTEHDVIVPLRGMSHQSVGAKEKQHIIELFAVHHARSTSMRVRLRQMLDDVVAAAPDRLEAKLSGIRLHSGRLPTRGELEAGVHDYHARDIASATTEVASLLRIRADAVQFLSRLHVQVFDVPEALPGLILGDVPVVYGKLSEQRFGIRDGLKFDQADFLGGALSRRQAAVFSFAPETHFPVTNADFVKTFNAQTLFAAKDRSPSTSSG